jgi:restriction system protein
VDATYRGVPVARSDPNEQFRRYQRQLEREAAREQAKIASATAREQAKEAKQRQLADRIGEAAELTARAEAQLQQLQDLLVNAVAHPVRPLALDSLRRTMPTMTLDLGVDATPHRPPRWEDFIPPEPGALTRALGRSRYERTVAEARSKFDEARHQHAMNEVAREARVATAQQQHDAQIAKIARDVAEFNERLDRMADGLAVRDRHAVSDYFEIVIHSIADPAGFPAARRAGYIPESGLLVLEWDLPRFDVVPENKAFNYVQRSDTIKPTPLAVAIRRTTYRQLIAAIALRAVWLAFNSDPDELIDTVVVNGMLDEIDGSTGQDVRLTLITLRATREQFAKIRIDRVKPVECVQKYFGANVSEHPEELQAVEPVISFDMADPRVIDPIDVLSEIDQRPNLLDLDGYGFEHFIQNLFAKMNLEVQVFKPGGDGGVDCVVYDRTAVFGGKYVVQAKRYAKTVPPSAVRDLYGTMLSEGATKGLLITTAGFGPSSYDWANNKPLHLISATELLGLCRKYDIPARIVPKTPPPKRK